MMQEEAPTPFDKDSVNAMLLDLKENRERSKLEPKSMPFDELLNQSKTQM